MKRPKSGRGVGKSCEIKGLLKEKRKKEALPGTIGERVEKRKKQLGK